jgi:hypothetical protein
MDAAEVRRRRNELTKFASRWWAGESEVARTFFAAPRSREEHLRWLWLQAYKELQPRTDGIIIRLIEKLHAEYPKLEAGVDRTDFLGTIQFLEEEFRHYVLFADIIQHLLGRPITIPEVAKYEYEQENKLRMLRRGYAEKHGGLARFASSFCEGGGASIYYEGSRIGGDPVSDAVARACKGVYDDEVDHAAHGADELAGASNSEADWALAHEMVAAISAQRLRMRNEQFGFPLSDERVAQIDRGDIVLPERLAGFIV